MNKENLEYFQNLFLSILAFLVLYILRFMKVGFLICLLKLSAPQGFYSVQFPLEFLTYRIFFQLLKVFLDFYTYLCLLVSFIFVYYLFLSVQGSVNLQHSWEVL